MGEIQKANNLSELRPMLIESRERVKGMVELMKSYIEDSTKFKTEYERAFARAKVKNFVTAKTKEEKMPTMLNALAEIDEEVMIAKDKWDTAYARLEAFTVELKAAEEDSISIKKAMSTIMAEMSQFGG